MSVRCAAGRDRRECGRLECRSRQAERRGGIRKETGMERRLVKDLDRVYLVFDIEDIDESEYILQMVLHGNLPALLPLSISTIDGKKQLRADVTGCTDIASRYRTAQLSGSDIRKILMTVNDVIRKLPGYLLDPQDLCLEPEYIFFGSGADEILLTYVPHLSESEPDTLRTLSEFFLKKLDHSDRLAADLAYGLFDRAQSENYRAGEVLDSLLRNAGDLSQTGGQTPEEAQLRGPGAMPPDISLKQPADGRLQGAGIIAPAEIRKRKAQASPDWQHMGKRTGMGRRRKQPERQNRKSTGHMRQRNAGGMDRRDHGRRPGQKSRLRKALPVIVILSAAAVLIVIFRMDLTQIGGMGFLSAALIWLTYSTLGRRRSEIHNVWADEEDPGDDAFYQSLLKQVYAQDAGSAGTKDVRREASTQIGGYRRQEGYVQQGRAGSPGKEPYMTRSDTGPCMVSLQPERCPDIPLSSSHLLLGKSRRKADVILPDDTVSRVHARIEHRTDGFYVSDLYSTNGSWLNDERLESGNAVLLKDGDVLRFGELLFRVHIPRKT